MYIYFYSYFIWDEYINKLFKRSYKNNLDLWVIMKTTDKNWKRWTSKDNKTLNYYIQGYSWNDGGYIVKSRAQGNFKIATFICENDAEDFCKYRNNMLNKYDTSNVLKYKHKRR